MHAIACPFWLPVFLLRIPPTSAIEFSQLCGGLYVKNVMLQGFLLFSPIEKTVWVMSLQFSPNPAPVVVVVSVVFLSSGTRPHYFCLSILLFHLRSLCSRHVSFSFMPSSCFRRQGFIINTLINSNSWIHFIENSGESACLQRNNSNN